MFPSLAPLAVKNAISGFGHGLLDARRVASIEVDGTSYEVGPGVALSSAYGNAGRTLSEDYCTTANYAALLGGSLHFANVSSVERLVLGLPVHTFNKYAAGLRDAFTGKLNFGESQVEITNVMVMPQPLGALIYFSKYHREHFDQANAHLVVDVGYFTTDWVVANGLTMDDRRSGGAPGGASQIYQRIAQLISADEGEPADDIERIDKCLRDNVPLLFCGKDLALRPYLEQSQAVISATVKEMQNKVGRTSDFTLDRAHRWRRCPVRTGHAGGISARAHRRPGRSVLCQRKGLLRRGRSDTAPRPAQAIGGSMTETLDMKVTISAVATPTLYRAMMSVTSPRQRAALLKRIAEDYLRGSSDLTSRSELPAFEAPLTRNAAHELLKGPSSAPALAQQQTRPIPAAQGEAAARYTPPSAQDEFCKESRSSGALQPCPSPFLRRTTPTTTSWKETLRVLDKPASVQVHAQYTTS